jgi:putative PIN family toxin of toxin-antitoxin system
VIVAVSSAIVQEVAEAVARPKFAARLTDLRTSIPELIESLLTLAEVCSPSRVIPVVTADPDDDKVLACARAARAQWLVSGDQHLLALRQYRGIRIATPQMFLKQWHDA